MSAKWSPEKERVVKAAKAWLRSRLNSDTMMEFDGQLGDSVRALEASERPETRFVLARSYPLLIKDNGTGFYYSGDQALLLLNDLAERAK